MKKLFVAITLMMASLLSAFAQQEESVYQRGATQLESIMPPTPESSSRVKYADVPFSHSLGAAELDIPLYTLEGRELSIPIGLHYRSNGIKLDEMAGVAGLGWTLEAGGCITRRIVYMPDHFSSPEFHHEMPSGTLLSQLENQTNNTATMAYLRDNLWRRLDSSLDRYSYNICGLSGTFVILDDGSVRQLSGDGVLIAVSGRDSQTNDITGFTVTGPDGTQYVLTVTEEGTYRGLVSNPTPSTGQDDEWEAITAWYLTGITSPSGLESATLTYTSGGSWERKVQSIAQIATFDKTASTQSVTTDYDGSYVRSTYTTQVLTSISLNGMTATFSYANVSGYDNHTPTSSWTRTPNYPKRLTGITVTDSSNQVYKVTVGTLESTNDGRVLLNNLVIAHRTNTADDRWDFTYKTKNTTVSRYSCDWYGYYNAENDGIPVIGQPTRNNFCPWVMDGSWGTFSLTWGTPNPTEADYMSLLTASHDGAQTCFTYEGSYYSSTPIGVRVKEIEVRDNESTLIRKRSFTYANGTIAGTYYPMLDQYMNVRASQVVTNGGLIHYIWSFSVHETPVTDGPTVQDTRVVYGVVTELDTDGVATNGAKTVYDYDLSDTHPSGTSTIGRFPSTWSGVYGPGTYVPSLNPWDGVRSGYEESGPKGPALLTRKDSYAWNGTSYELVERENYTYEAHTRTPVLVDYKVVQVMVHSAYGEVGGLQQSDLYHYPVYAKVFYSEQPKSIVKIGYHANGNDTTTVEHNYVSRSDMSFPPRIMSTERAVDKKIRILRYYYPDTYADAPLWASSLVSAHRLSVPIRRELRYTSIMPPPWQRESSDSKSKSLSYDRLSGTIWKDETTEYATFFINHEAYLLPKYRIEKTDGVESWRETVNRRDNLGNVQSVKEKGRPETVIFWGYGGRYPVAVIENASYSDVSLLLGSSFIRYYNPWDTPDSGDIAAFNGLRSDLPDAHVTVMEWLPGIGIKSMTDPSGVKTTWTYDNAGRLQYVKDASGNTLEGYEYNLYNNGGNGRLSMRHKHYRSSNVSADDVSWWNTLGQRLEDIAIRGSGDGQKTLVTAYEGDYLLHDDVKTWLPYPITATTGNFVTNAASASSSYHSNNKSYYHKGYEQSSRDIVTTTAVPGYVGVHDNVESIESVTGFPNLVWTDGVGIEGTTEIYRSRNIVEKRSVDADGRRHSQFVHPIGLLLATSWGSATPASTDPAPTYHVYDQYDRLRAVVGSGIALTDTLNMWRYSYDAMDRLSSKGIPGAEREFYTYDSENNVISIRQGDELREMEYNNFGQVTKVYLKKGTAPRVLMEEHEYGTGGLETYAKLAEVDGDGAVTGYTETEYTYDSKARLISAVTEDVLGGTLTESYTYNFPGDVTNHTTSYAHGTVTDALSITYDYDIRGRVVESVSTLSLGGSTSSSVTTQYSYDALGRPSGQISTASGTGGTLNKVTVTDGYTLQGWLNSHQVKKGTQALFTESLKYDSPSSTSGGNALYTGLISERGDQWKFTSYGQGVTTTDGYRYDNGGRLTYVKRGGVESNLSYDARGNVLTAEGSSYTYSGDRVSTFTPFGQSAVYFTHDSRGRMTYDGVGGVTIDYNYLNLTRKISGTGGTLAKYSYLANGSKTGAENGSGEGLVYRGSLIYKKASNGTLTFDGASIPEGRLLSGATRLYVTDHLGSVKAVVNGNNGNLYEVNNYTVYGKRSANSSANSYLSTAPSGEKFRQHFTGKEDQTPDFTVPFTDFGARQYSPALRRWLVPDPLSEKYYGISPYAYCAGDPVNLVDPDGRIWLNPKLVAFLKEQTNARIESLEQRKTEIEDYDEQVNNLRQALSDIDLLENDENHYYALTDNWGDESHVRIGAGGIVLIDTSSDGISLHEIHHVAQSLLARGLEFSENGFLKNAALNRGVDKGRGIQLYEAIASQEIEAYKIQFSMDGKVPMCGVNSLKGINVESVGALVNAQGGAAYPAIKALSDYLKQLSSFR